MCQIHSLNKNLSSVYHVQGTGLGTRDIALSLIDDSEEEKESTVKAKGTGQPKALKEERSRMCSRNGEKASMARMQGAGGRSTG